MEKLAEANILTGDDVGACSKPDGTALVKASEASFAFDKTKTGKKCVLIVYKKDTKKKATLTLPKDFGGVS